MWPGSRCDRCQRYDYVCSASRTIVEEQSAGKGGDSLDAHAPSFAPVSEPNVRQLWVILRK